MAERWHTLKQALRRGFIAVVLIGLLLPLVGPAGHGENKENRERAAQPPLPRSWKQWKAFPQASEAYFRDHFAFRDTLVAANDRLKVDVLGISASPKAALGPDGWLFLLGDWATKYQRKPGFSPRELNDLTFMLSARQQWLAHRNIKFLFFAAPNKHTIYPEVLPPAARPLW